MLWLPYLDGEGLLVEIHEVGDGFFDGIEGPETRRHPAAPVVFPPPDCLRWDHLENTRQLVGDQPGAEVGFLVRKMESRLVIVGFQRQHHRAADHCDALRMLRVDRCISQP
jgi:hypothetical protein